MDFDAPLPFTCRSFGELRKMWAKIQSPTTVSTRGTEIFEFSREVTLSTVETSTASVKSLVVPFSNVSSEPEKENIHFVTTTTTTTNGEIDFSVIPFLNVSLGPETENIQFTATTTTTTTTANRESDYLVEKTLLVDESKVTTTKTYVIVFVVIITALGCVVVVVAYIRYMKRKRNVVLPTIVYHRNQPVVIPDVSETPVNTHRTRIAELSQNFLPLTVSISSSRFGQQQQQQQQFQEIKVEDIKFFVPDFSPFPGFDIAEFRQILANVQNRARPLITSSTSDPVAVFQSFPEIDCLN